MHSQFLNAANFGIYSFPSKKKELQ